MTRCDIHELLPYGGDQCTDCGTTEQQSIVVGPWREAILQSPAEEPEPFVGRIAN